MSNVVSIFKNAQPKRDLAYEAKVLTMGKLELLEEMVHFQEERSRVGSLTLALIMRGIPLFKAIAASAETEELRILTTSYRRHLEHEMAVLLQAR